MLLNCFRSYLCVDYVKYIDSLKMFQRRADMSEKTHVSFDVFLELQAIFHDVFNNRDSFVKLDCDEEEGCPIVFRLFQRIRRWRVW